MRLLPAIAFFVALCSTALAEPARYELDPEHTTIGFKVDHIGYAPTYGFFTDVSGSFVYDIDTNTLGEVRVEVASASIESFNRARDNHVKGKDFLDTRSHPAIVFTAQGGSAKSKTSGTVTGNLTMLGQTHPVTLDVTLHKAAEYPFGHKRFTLGLSLEGEIKRSQFGMNYAVANGLVGDTVTLLLATEAMRVQ